MMGFYKDDAVVDAPKIIELKNLLEDAFPLLIHTYITETDSQIVKLEEYVGKEQYSEIKKIAHSMKGASSNMGARYLASLASSIEEICKKEEYQSVSELIQLIKTHQIVLKPLLYKSL